MSKTKAPKPGDYGQMTEGGYWLVSPTREQALDDALAIDEGLVVSESQVQMTYYPADHWQGDYGSCPDNDEPECKHVLYIDVWEVRYP